MKLKHFYREDVDESPAPENTYFFFIFDRSNHDTCRGLVIDKKGNYSSYLAGWIFDDHLSNDPDVWQDEEIVSPNTIPNKRSFIQKLFEEFS